MKMPPSATRMAAQVRRLGGKPSHDNKNKAVVVSCFRCKNAGKTHCKIKPRFKLRDIIICEEHS